MLHLYKYILIRSEKSVTKITFKKLTYVPLNKYNLNNFQY